MCSADITVVTAVVDITVILWCGRGATVAGAFVALSCAVVVLHLWLWFYRVLHMTLCT